MKSTLAVLSGDKQMAGDLYTSADSTLHLSLERPVLPRLVLTEAPAFPKAVMTQQVSKRRFLYLPDCV